MSESLSESFDRLGIDAAGQIVDSSRDVIGPITDDGPAIASLGASILYLDVTVEGVDAVLSDAAAALGDDLERSDEYADRGHV